MSSLEFDGDSNVLSLYDSSGRLVGSWPASNRGGPSSDLHPRADESYLSFIPDGKYEFERDSQRAPEKHRDPKLDSVNGPYGTWGILKLKPLIVNGQEHKGLGVHAGRQTAPDSTLVSRKPFQQTHHRGAYHRTSGCIRTIEPAMNKIASLIAKDPLTLLEVKNNGKNPISKIPIQRH